MSTGTETKATCSDCAEYEGGTCHALVRYAEKNPHLGVSSFTLADRSVCHTFKPNTPEGYMTLQQTREDRLVETVTALAKSIKEISEENNQMRAAVRMYQGRNERVEASNVRLEKQRDEANERILTLQDEVRELEKTIKDWDIRQ